MNGSQMPSSHAFEESKFNHVLLQFILILLSGLGPTSFQIFLPSVPSLVEYFKEGANKQVISSQADSLIKISRIWADFFPANTSNQPI